MDRGAAATFGRRVQRKGIRNTQKSFDPDFPPRLHSPPFSTAGPQTLSPAADPIASGGGRAAVRVGTAAGVCVWRGEEVNATGMGGASSPTQSPKAFGLPGLPRALSMRAGESEALDVASIVADAADGSAVDGAGDEVRRSLRLTPELAAALADSG